MSLFKNNNDQVCQKNWIIYSDFSDSNPMYTLQKFYVSKPEFLSKSNYHQMLVIGADIEPIIFENSAGENP